MENCRLDYKLFPAASQLSGAVLRQRGLNKNTYEAAVETINNQPTAYDVDKVVERLEVNSMFEEKDEAFVMLDDAVEIVKSGGIDEIKRSGKNERNSF